MCFAQSPINLEQAQLEPVSQGLVHMIACRNAVQPEFCQLFADRLDRLVLQQAAPDIGGHLVELINLLSGLAEQDRPVVQQRE